jgi:hypothetical protein
MIFSDGNIYEGEFKDGNRNGKGKMIFSNGDIYEGEFKDGIENGKGKKIFSNGDIYEGEFKEGNFNEFENKKNKDIILENIEVDINIYSVGNKCSGEIDRNLYFDDIDENCFENKINKLDSKEKEKKYDIFICEERWKLEKIKS